MRGVARGLGVALVLASMAFAAQPASAQAPDFTRSLRDLDGAQFLEDETIWICDPAAAIPARGNFGVGLQLRLVGSDDTGRFVRVDSWYNGPRSGRAGELTMMFDLPQRGDLHPLGPGPRSGLRAGRYEIRRSDRDTAEVLARFRVIEPRGSELAVRAALARARRLRTIRETGGRAIPIYMIPPERMAASARLYEAVLARYPRTSYRTTIYSQLPDVLGQSSYVDDPGRWLEEVFAHFHSACFGVWALDHYMVRTPNDEARPQLRRLVGLYPDTMLSRAAARYL